MLTDDYVKFVDYPKERLNKTNHETIVKNIMRLRSVTLKILMDHLTVGWLDFGSLESG